MLEEIGRRGQAALLAAKVLIIGAGGLGSPAAMYLTAAGVGTIGIADPDKVDLTNLQRQIIHHTGNIGDEKTASAREKLLAINPQVTVQTYPQPAKAENIRAMIAGYDFVIDATDNFPAKFLINDACFFEGKPFSHAGVLRFEGQTMTVLPGQTACYRCVFGFPPGQDSPATGLAGVLATVPGVIGTIQATEAIKCILQIADLLTNQLLIYNALTMDFRKIQIKRNPDCPLCGGKPRITELKDQT